MFRSLDKTKRKGMSGLIRNAIGHLRFKRVLSAMSNQWVFECDADKVIQAKKSIEHNIIYSSSFFSIQKNHQPSWYL